MTNLIRIALPSVKTGDPHLCTDSHALLCIRRMLFPGMEYTKYDVNPDGRKWTFYLRRNITFPNGREVKAEDVIYSIRRASSPDREGQLFTVPYSEYFGGARLTAADQYTVIIDNPVPFADLPEFLPDLAILPAGWKSWSDGSGTGPYVLDLQTDEKIVLRKRSGYKLPDTLEFTAVPDPEERLEAVRSGRTDAALDPPLNSAAGTSAKDQAFFVGWDTNLSVIFFIDCSSHPFNDIRIRQALNYAVDKEKLIESIVYGQGKVLNGPFSDRHFAHDPSIAPYPWDPEKAGQLLKEAGYTASSEENKTGSGALQVDIHAPTSLPGEGPALAEFLAESFRSIGIHPRVHLHQDRFEYARKVAAKELHGLFCFDSSPGSSYKVLHEKLDSSFAGTWWQGYHSEQLNELISRAAAAGDDSLRRKIYRSAYRILHDEAPWLFLYQARRFWAVRKGFTDSLSINRDGFFETVK